MLVITTLLFLAAILTLAAPRLLTYLHAKSRLFTVENVPKSPAAIVFGAGLRRDGTPTPVLRDRVKTAVDLYHSGKIDSIIMSGDHSTIYYNEPGAMADYAVGLGVPEEVIHLDYAGKRTYDTCFRAREIFGIHQAILVTQIFHLPRALYTCNSLGVEATGVPADVRQYRKRSLVYWNLREVPATIVALWQIYFSPPKLLLGNSEIDSPMEVQ